MTTENITTDQLIKNTQKILEELQKVSDHL